VGDGAEDGASPSCRARVGGGAEDGAPALRGNGGGCQAVCLSARVKDYAAVRGLF